MKGSRFVFFRLGERCWLHLAAIGLLGLASAGRMLGQVPSGAQRVTAQAPVANSNALASSLAFSSYVNNDLPEWLRVSGEYRIRPEAHTGYSFVPGVDDAYALSRLRLNLDLTPTPWFHAFIQGQDSRALGIDPTHITGTVKDVFDLRQAYIEFRNGERGWIRLRAGRQEMQFGAQRLVGARDWSNTAQVFDGMRLTLGSDGKRVDVFTSSVVVNYPTSFNDHLGGMSFHGAYGSLTRLVPRAILEPYVFWKTAPTVKSEEGKLGNESLFTPGFRWVGSLPLGFDYAAEAARQAGHYSVDDIDAWGGYGILGYRPSLLPLHPRFSAEYGYATGEKAQKNGKFGTFDQLYPATHGTYGNIDLFGWRNVRHLRASAEVKAFRRLGLNFDYHALALASRYDGLYNTSGSIIVKAPKGGALSTDVGQETDGYFKYQLRSNINFGAGIGHLFAGQFLKQNSKGSDATYPYFFFSQTF